MGKKEEGKEKEVSKGREKRWEQNDRKEEIKRRKK